MTDIVTSPERAVQTANNFAYRWFSPQPDPAGTDTWRSHADDALAGRLWKGDCDDLASTALDLLIRANPGIDERLLYRLCVKTQDCPSDVPYDHMVAGCMIRPGVLMLFGDTLCHPHIYARSPHHIVRYASIAEGVVWREGHP